MTTRVAVDADGRSRTAFDDIDVGASLGEVEWTMSRENVEGLIQSDMEFDPWYEDETSGGDGFVPWMATYPPVRILFTRRYNIRGLFYEFESEFIRPIPYGTTITIAGAVADKWVKRNREYVKYQAIGTDDQGAVFFRTWRTHVLDFLTTDIPRTGKGIDSGSVTF